METEIVDPPPKTDVKPPTAGDKFKAEFAKLEPESATGEPAKPVIEEPKKPAEAKEPDKTVATEKPSSPLEAALGKDKPTKVEESADDLKEFDKVTSPNSENWKRLREAANRRQTRIIELDTEITSLKSAPKVDTKEVDALRQERDELNERVGKLNQNLKAINAEYSEDYQKLTKEREGVITKIGSRMKAYGGNSETLIEALSLPEGKFKTQQIKEALAELDPDDKSRIHTLIESLDTTDEKILDFRKDLPAKWEEITKRREDQLREEQAENLKQLESQFGKIVDELPKSSVTLREIADDVPGAEEWNAEIKASKQDGLAALKPNGTDFNQTVEIAVKGRHYDKLEKRFLALHSDYIEAMKRLKEFDAARPDFTGGKKPSTEVKKKPSQRYDEALAAQQSAEA